MYNNTKDRFNNNKPNPFIKKPSSSYLTQNEDGETVRVFKKIEKPKTAMEKLDDEILSQIPFEKRKASENWENKKKDKRKFSKFDSEDWN